MTPPPFFDGTKQARHNEQGDKLYCRATNRRNGHGLHTDGHVTQDCEQAAGKRWLATHAEQMAPHGVTLLGDDLYSKQPFCALALAAGFNFILVCKPDSHPELSERVAFWQANNGIATYESRHWNGRFTEVSMYRSLNDVLLLNGKDALSVNGFESTALNAKTGEQLYHKSFVTNHRVTAEHVAAVAQAGRGRWKSENEHNNRHYRQ